MKHLALVFSLLFISTPAHAWRVERWTHLITADSASGPVTDIAACPGGSVFAAGRAAYDYAPYSIDAILQLVTTAQGPRFATPAIARSGAAERPPNMRELTCARGDVDGRPRLLMLSDPTAASTGGLRSVDLLELSGEWEQWQYNTERQLVTSRVGSDPFAGRSVTGIHVGYDAHVLAFDTGRRVADEYLGLGTLQSVRTTSVWAARDVASAERRDGSLAVLALNDRTGSDRYWLACANGNTSYAFEAEQQTDSWLAFIGGILAAYAVDVELSIDRNGVAHVYVLNTSGQIWRGDITGMVCRQPPAPWPWFPL